MGEMFSSDRPFPPRVSARSNETLALECRCASHCTTRVLQVRFRVEDTNTEPEIDRRARQAWLSGRETEMLRAYFEDEAGAILFADTYRTPLWYHLRTHWPQMCQRAERTYETTTRGINEGVMVRGDASPGSGIPNEPADVPENQLADPDIAAVYYGW